MLSILQTRYARLETALDTLLESIASYNASTDASDELLFADEEVNSGLDELATHHGNYARILALRKDSTWLDEQIKSTVALLSDTRNALLHVSSLPDTSNDHQVKVDDVLDYARFISKTTVPPTLRNDRLSKEDLSSKIIESSNAMFQDVQVTNGEHDKAAAEQLSALSQEAKAMLDPVSQLSFVPWPTQEIINNGALGDIQGMVEQGRDPNAVLGRDEIASREKTKAEEHARREAEDEERAKARREDMMHIGSTARSEQHEDVFDPDEM